MGIYQIIESYSKQDVFKYVVIVILFLYFFFKIEIGLNIILALFFAVVTVAYLSEKNTIADKTEEEQKKIKFDTIKPVPKFISKNSDVIDFLFSVQDFYLYNPQAFEEMVDNLDAFFVLNENIFKEAAFDTYYYQIAESKKNNALNSFHSIIFKLPTEKLFTDKFDRAHKRLETVLNKYMNNIYNKCNSNLMKDGYTTIKRPINLGPAEYNTYNDEVYSWQIY